MDAEHTDDDRFVPTTSARQVELARRLGIEVTSEMSPRELGRLISEAPATPEQVTFAQNLLGSPLPDGATFGQVSRLLDALVPLKNQVALATTDWDVNDILTFRGMHYRIVKILRHLDYRLYLQPVDLEPGDPDMPARAVDTKGRQEWRYPMTLLEENATKVDLSSWTDR